MAPTAAVATGQSSIRSIWWERWRRKPTWPPRSTATRTRRAPAEAVGVPGDRLHHDRSLQPGHAGQLFLDPRRLEPALGPELHVLVVAATAAARTGVRARGLDPVGRGLQDGHGVGPQVGAAGLGHPGPDPLTGQGVPDEDHPAVGRPGHAAAAGRHRADQEFQLVAVRRLPALGLARARHGGRS